MKQLKCGAAEAVEEEVVLLAAAMIEVDRCLLRSSSYLVTSSAGFCLVDVTERYVMLEVLHLF